MVLNALGCGRFLKLSSLHEILQSDVPLKYHCSSIARLKHLAILTVAYLIYQVLTAMSSDREAAILEHGFTAVPRDVDEKILKGAKNVKDPIPLSTEHIDFPSEPLVQKIQEYAKAHLNEQTFNHSMRVYYYGKSCQQSNSLVTIQPPNLLVAFSVAFL